MSNPDGAALSAFLTLYAFIGFAMYLAQRRRRLDLNVAWQAALWLPLIFLGATDTIRRQF